MCGRFENKVREDWMVQKFAEFDIAIILNTGNNQRIMENIAPTNSILTILNDRNRFFAEQNRWGIKFSTKSPLIFNSRIETISIKPFWKMLFDKNRCLIPMTAFYEWKKIKSKKVPQRISLKNEELFFVPGLSYIDKNGVRQISLITTKPNDFMQNIHNRMPVILEMKDAISYLHDTADSNIKKCLPYKDSNKMTVEPASI